MHITTANGMSTVIRQQRSLENSYSLLSPRTHCSAAQHNLVCVSRPCMVELLLGAGAARGLQSKVILESEQTQARTSTELHPALAHLCLKLQVKALNEAGRVGSLRSTPYLRRCAAKTVGVLFCGNDNIMKKRAPA